MYINIPFSKTFLTPPSQHTPCLPCSREASSMVAHACLLEGGFRIKVQCNKNKIKNKSKLKSGAGGNWVNRKYLFIKASLQANQVFLHPQRPTLALAYFLVTLRSASLQETKALTGGPSKGAWQREQHALLALEQLQGSPKKHQNSNYWLI